ncbi:MAG: hypothetical protein ABI781_07565 [Burkholderiales bacterium]
MNLHGGHRLDDAALLALWERGVGEGGVVRDDLVLHALAPDGAPPRTLGERNARLLSLHAQCFGGAMALLSHCPQCGAASQFDVDSDALAAELPVAAERAADPAVAHRLEWQGHAIEFRLPDAADVAAESRAPDEEAFAQALLRRCVLACTHDGAALSLRDVPAPALDALSRRMEALDPAASVSFALECPQCAAHWDARLDVGQMLWHKLQAAAERVLLEVDALARCYGWSEREVLRLSPTRRAAYLQLAAA